MQSLVEIADWVFDLGKPVYLLHPNNKFWEVTLSGKLKDGSEQSVEQVDKDYPSHTSAKTSVIGKIEEKLTKGYYPQDAKKAEKNSKGAPEKKEPEVKTQKTQKKNEKSSNAFSGEYYQKGSDAIRIEIDDKRVKITRIDSSGRQKFEIRSMGSHNDAVDFCLKEEQWVIGEGYKANHDKFVYSFGADEEKEQGASKRKKDTEKSSNFLSVVQMTDDAISHRSRNVSETKSDRSYIDSGSSEQKYLPSKLGSPTSECIKVLLAQTWSDDVDPTNWIMSEKLDGVRMFWTGSAMFSRNGNRFYFPKFFTKNWPNSQLDGELFIGRGKFSETLSAVKKTNPIDEQWKNVNYLVFDCPGLKKPFNIRVKMMEEVIKAIDNPHIKCHGHRVCTGYEDLFAELERVNKIQGEGLMLRNPDSMYENRRSKSLLKVKTFHDDEATVLGYTEGTGRCYGMVGALKVRNSHGVEFEVGSGLTDANRRKPPKIGTKITYKYQEFIKSSGKPRFPTFLRVFDHI